MGLEMIGVIRKRLNMSVEELSEKSGIPLGTLSKISAGITKDPKLDTVKAIARALGCSLDDFDDVQGNESMLQTEIEHIKKYRDLDGHGQKAVDAILDIEYTRPRITESDGSLAECIRSLPEYDLPASAGSGVYLHDDVVEFVNVPLTDLSRRASYIIRVAGVSMEPTFNDGDRLYVEETDVIDLGEIGIFVIDGEGFVKQQGDGFLISLNPDSPDIRLFEHSDVRCWGLVLGKGE